MKRMCCHFLACLLLTACLVVHADLTEGPYTYTLSGGKATITKFSSAYSGALFITTELGGCPVTTIGKSAFEKKSCLTSVTIPDSVTTIGSYAFYWCTGLTNIIIGSHVTTIGDSAFSECSGLTCVEIGSSVITISDWAFYNCRGLTNVIIGSSVTTLDNSVFFGCSSLTSICVESANAAFSSVGGVLFNKTKGTLILCPEGRVGDYTIADSVTSIGASAFKRCSGLTSVIIPISVTNIGELAFLDCTGLTSVKITDSITTIGDSAFKGCTGLQRVYFAGKPPQTNDSPFTNTSATLYYLPCFSSFWTTTFAGRPTLCWNPTVAVAPTPSAATGFSCVVSGTSTIPMAFEATTNLNSGNWARLCTTNLTSSSITLLDPESASHPARFYRVVAP